MYAQAVRANSASSVGEVRAYLELHRAELLAMLATDGQAGVALAHRHSKIMDGLVSALYPAAYATIQHQRRWIPVLLGAVGGYGRQLLGWKSDLDVRLLTTEAPERIQPIAEAILYPLWDAGVSIGHQVMTIRDAVDAAREDLPTATALLDFQPLAGEEAAGKMLGGAHLRRHLQRGGAADLHRAAREGGHASSWAVRRLGLSPRARRPERRGRTPRSGHRALGRAGPLLWVLDGSEGEEGLESSLPKLEADLKRVIGGLVAPRDLVSQRGRSRWSDQSSPSVSTTVVIDHRASPRHTVIEILTKDRPGLPFALAQALHELSLTIAVAKINTEGTRVADVFYVTETDGKKIHHGARTEEVRERLLATLAGLA